MATQRSSILDDLRERITAGIVPPGTHLAESGLAEEYGISRTPIRWILRELAREGLVVAEPNRGVFVAEWTSSDAAEVMDLRALLEAKAASLAAQRITPELRERLVRLRDDMERLADQRHSDHRTRISDLNRTFHLAILEAAASPRLYNLAKDLANGPLMQSSFQYYDDAEMQRSLAEHRAVLDAIVRGDSDHARVIMESHLRSAYAALVRHETAASVGAKAPAP